MTPASDRSAFFARTRLRLAETMRAANPLVLRHNRRYLREVAEDLPVPPAHVLVQVAGSADVRWFLESGRLAVEAMSDALARQGTEPDDLHAILDFGCGCCRVARHWPSRTDAAITGVDYNPRQIAWCRRHLPFGHFAVNDLLPPLAFPDASFDLIYALSVLTHLPVEAQFAWLDELARLLRPGGYLLLSLHGAHYRDEMSADELSTFDRGDVVVRHATVAGTNRCTTFHSEAFIRNQMQRGLTLIEHIPKGATGNPFQDQVLLRRP